MTVDEHPPMTADELTALVELIVAYTGREPDETMLDVWGTQAGLGRWTFPEASRALHAWAGNHPAGEWLDPAKLADLIRAARRDRGMRERAAVERKRTDEVQAAITADGEPGASPADPDAKAPPATPEFRRQMLANIAADLGWDRGDTRPAEFRDTALAVACPHCGAPPGQFCHVLSRPNERLVKRGAHPSRVELLAAS